MPEKAKASLSTGKVDVGDLTEAVTTAVSNALIQRKASSETPEMVWNPRIIIGLILEGLSGNLPAASTSQMGLDQSHLASVVGLLTAERVALLKSSPERLALIRDFTARMSRDPLFMSLVESTLRDSTAQHDRDKIAAFDPTTFGWEPEPDLPKPKAAAAAVAAAVAAMIVAPIPPPLPI